MRTISGIKISPRWIPVLLSLLILGAYGLLIFRPGLYWDDWTFAWLSHFFGPTEFIPAFSTFRPFLGPIFTVTTAIFGTSPQTWQIIGLATRLLFSISAWWTFSIVWPNEKRQILSVVMLMAVFPGYGQQWVALTHVNQEWIPLISYVLSLGLTAWVLRNPSKEIMGTLLALVFMFVGLFSTEYFFGLEIFRGFIIFVMLPRDRFSASFVRTLKRWAPYLLLWIINIIWLIRYYSSGEYESYGLEGVTAVSALTSRSIFTIFNEILHTLITAGISSWFQIITIWRQPPHLGLTWITFGLTVLSFGALAFLLPRLQLSSNESRDNEWAYEAITIGVMGILAGRLPSWAANLGLSLDFAADRFMISMMMGSCFLLVGLITLLLKSQKLQMLVLSAILALSIGFQFSRANTFRHDTEMLQRFFWQLSWRIPGMKPGTAIMTNQLPITYESDFQLSAPLNWIYAADQRLHPNRLDYLLIATEVRLGHPTLPSLAPSQPINKAYRTALFKGSTSDAIVISYAPYSCVKVLDEAYYDKENFPKYMGDSLSQMIANSDLTRIITDAPQPDLAPSLFGKEPEHSWCYFYEKADLERQSGRWDQARNLLDNAISKGYGPQDPLEWLFLIETYARTGSLHKAESASNKLLSDDPYLRPNLCKIWERVSFQIQDPAEKSGIADYLNEIPCTP